MLGRLAILSRELEPRHSDSADERERMPWKDKLAPSSAGALAPAQGRLVFCEPSLCLGLIHAVWSHLHLLRIRKPRAHMHTRGASERATAHTCPTREKAGHLPDILCGLTRARNHHIARAAARKQGA
jgi:hypothetical protein